MAHYMFVRFHSNESSAKVGNLRLVFQLVSLRPSAGHVVRPTCTVTTAEEMVSPQTIVLRTVKMVLLVRAGGVSMVPSVV